MANKEHRQGLAHALSETLTRLWLWEVWLESRTTFKLLTADVVKFLLIMAFIYLGHYVTAKLPISEGRRQVVEYVHFIGLMTTWILFIITLIAEITVDTIKRLKESVQKKNTNKDKAG